MKELLNKYRLSVDQLTGEELETLEKWATDQAKKEVTIPKIVDYINAMIDSVSKELASSIDNRKWWFQRLGESELSLKMRLKNYLMLRDFLCSAERARKFIENNLENVRKS